MRLYEWGLEAELIYAVLGMPSELAGALPAE
jgi:hypothetical protein